MLFPHQITSQVVDCAEWADRLIRSELIAGIIANENDYTSNFVGALRREINSRNVPDLHAMSFVLKAGAERRVGSDAAIILANTREFKICLFEAKWPRLSTHVNSWDSVQQSSNQSHFHDQLIRQSRVAGTFAIWEMFYTEHPFNSNVAQFPHFGSACVWHSDAYKASHARKNIQLPWTDAELKQLLQNHRIAVGNVMQEVCECRSGKPYPGNDFIRPFIDYGVPEEALLIQYDGPLPGQP
ncbi:hypothetical protein ACFQUU_26005 [Herbaspirillum sp. GCM10030257]|uniref:hypothetical protein n=1 Tax=Herbaspirillum sp. GCM10030257 TaxID=3273393 RepID=UPI00361D5259